MTSSSKGRTAKLVRVETTSNSTYSRFLRSTKFGKDEIKLDYRKSVTGKKVGGNWQFDIPSRGLDFNKSCYVAIADSQKPIPLRANRDGLDTYLISLSAINKAKDRERNLQSYKRRVSDAKSRLSSYKNKYQVALKNLPKSELYKGGTCQIAKPRIPKRPANAMSAGLSSRKAEEIATSCMLDRLVCDVGSDLAVKAGNLPSWMSVPASYVCGQASQNNLCPKDELTWLADLAQGAVTGCLTNDNANKIACGLVVFPMLYSRFKIDAGRVESRLSGPYDRWKSAVSSEKRKARIATEKCSTTLDLVKSAPTATKELESNVSKAEQALRVCKQRNPVKSTYTGYDLACPVRIRAALK